MKRAETAPPSTFGGFLQFEMRRRGMSGREFAAYCGVSHTVINKFLNHGTEDATYSGLPLGDPELKVLTAIARATGTDLCSLVRLVVPDAPTATASTLELAQRIERLDPEDQALIDRILLGTRFQSRKDED